MNGFKYGSKLKTLCILDFIVEDIPISLQVYSRWKTHDLWFLTKKWSNTYYRFEERTRGNHCLNLTKKKLENEKVFKNYINRWSRALGTISARRKNAPTYRNLETGQLELSWKDQCLRNFNMRQKLFDLLRVLTF